MAAVEDDAEFPAPLHLLEQRPRVVRVERELADLEADVVARRGHDELLQPDQPCGQRETRRVTHSLPSPPPAQRSQVFLPLFLYRTQSGLSSLPQMAVAKGKSEPRCHVSIITNPAVSSCSKAEWLFPGLPMAELGSLHWWGRGE